MKINNFEDKTVFTSIVILINNINLFFFRRNILVVSASFLSIYFRQKCTYPFPTLYNRLEIMHSPTCSQATAL